MFSIGDIVKRRDGFGKFDCINSKHGKVVGFNDEGWVDIEGIGTVNIKLNKITQF